MPAEHSMSEKCAQMAVNIGAPQRLLCDSHIFLRQLPRIPADRSQQLRNLLDRIPLRQFGSMLRSDRHQR
jgi:hypothetical protein